MGALLTASWMSRLGGPCANTRSSRQRLEIVRAEAAGVMHRESCASSCFSREHFCAQNCSVVFSEFLAAAASLQSSVQMS
jgi:hypothetical protein